MSAVQQLLTDHIDIWTTAETEKKTGRGRASGNAGSVYGIKKLRELILELAVRGKLVPQEPKDEPASELLKRIQAEKSKLIAEGKIKKDKPLPPITDGEKPFELPKGWEWTTLASISLVNPRNNAEDNSPASFVPMTMIGTKFSSSHDQEARLWKEIKQGFTHFAEGDIGVAKITPCFENSKACVFSGLLSGVGAGTTELHIVRPLNATLSPRFVLAYLKSPQFLLVGETRMTGTAGQKRLPKEFVESNPFPLPPLPEQSRIVAKVDELMALCDQLETQHTNATDAHEKLVSHLLGTLTHPAVRGDPSTSLRTKGNTEPDPSTNSVCSSMSSVHPELVEGRTEFEENWQRIAAHFDTLFTTEASIDALKQSLLQLAVMGKLVPQDANDEPASVLLERIAAEKGRLVKEGLLKKQQPLADITDAEMPFEIPGKWEWSRLGNIGIGNTGKTPSTGTPKYYGGAIPFIGPGQITQAGEILDSDKNLTEEGCEYSAVAEPGDVLMVCIGGSIGKSAITVSRVAFNQQINCIRPIFVSPVLLNYSMSTPHFQAAVLEKATGSATPIINRSNPNFA